MTRTMHNIHKFWWLALLIGACLTSPISLLAQTSGLVAAYSLNQGSGTTVADSSGNGFTGTISGATWTTSGKYGSALSFNGTKAYVDLLNPDALRLTGSMTLSAWVFPTTIPGDDGQIIAKSNNSGGWQLKTTPDTGVRTFGIALSSGKTPVQRYSKTVVTLNTWYHVAGVYNAASKTLDIYVNGALDNGVLTGTIPAKQTNSTVNVNIGRRTGGYLFGGTIDEVRVYNTALTQAQIQTDMATPVEVVDTQAPTAPSALTATAASSTQINLSWTASTDNIGVTGYRVERCQGAGCTTFTQIATATTTTFSDTGLAINTSYSYRVRAADAATNLSGYSNTATASTPADTQAPTAPSALTATAASSTQINLSWTASTDNIGVTGYRVERCQGAGCTTFTQIATATTTTFSDTGLAINTSYSYRVRAADAATNLSGYSNTATASTPADTQAPTAPSALTATAASSTQINLNWTASTDNIGLHGYSIERCLTATCTFLEISPYTTSTIFIDAGLAAGVGYSYRVRASDSAGNLSPYSNIASATTPNPDTQAPTAPTNLTASAASGSQINLSWTGATDNVAVTDYLIERCQGSGCTTFTQIASTGSAATTYSDSGLTPGSTYTYQIRATDAAGNFSSYSAMATGSTPSAPSGLVSGYGFSEGFGTTTADSSGNGLTGALQNTTWTLSGKYGTALVFNGTTSYVDLGTLTSWQLTSSSTWSAWVFPTANPPDDGQIIAKSGDSDGWQLKTTPDTGVRTFGVAVSNGTSNTQRI